MSHYGPEHVKEMTEALGNAALACWGQLPQEIQQLLFESAAGNADEGFRSSLALYLHEHHPRTAD
jgi:hypothetical protein